MIKSDSASLPGYATLTSSVTGLLIGGRVIAHHQDGEVTIAFAGSLHRRGKPLSPADRSPLFVS